MSDYSDGSGPIARRPRVNDGPPPVSGVVAIVLAVIAVVAGYFILRSITDDGTAVGGVPNPGGAEAPAPTASSVPTSDNPGTLPPVPTEPPGLDTTGAAVLVANANGRGGSAGRAASVLANSAGFQMTDSATDATESTPDIDTSAIYFDPANPEAEKVAQALNTVLGGTLNVQPMPDPVPVVDGDLMGAGVLLMLGRDFAEMAPADLDLSQIEQAGDATAATDPPAGGTTESTTAP